MKKKSRIFLVSVIVILFIILGVFMGNFDYNKLSKVRKEDKSVNYIENEMFKYGSFNKKIKVQNKNKLNSQFFTSGPIYTCPNNKMTDENLVVVDGKKVKNIKTKVDGNRISYLINDSMGSVKRGYKKIIYKDHEAPSLTINGSDIVNLYVGDNYEEAGYSAIDDCDGEISYKVRTIGKPDTKKEGTYHLKYSVSDSSRNKTELTRTVVVSEKPKNGVVYLTFDDGPRMGTTNIILDILKKEGVPATFFVTNSGPDSLILREFRENHSVALHSSSHNYSYVYSSLNNYFSDLSSVHDRVYKITGYDSRIIRFPGGSSNTVSRKYSPGIMTELTKEVVQKGYKYYDWNINSGDAGETTDPNVIVENVTSKLSKDRENVILMHDIKPYTRDALERIIKIAKDRGYQFDKITTKTDMMVQKINN